MKLNEVLDILLKGIWIIVGAMIIISVFKNGFS